MGMSTHVVGLKPADERWFQMKEIWDMCTKAKIDIPEEVDDFFEGEYPDAAGMPVEIYDACSEYRADMQEGYEIDITKLPKDVTVVRVYNSY